MTTPEACDLIARLTCQLRDEMALRTSLEADVVMYRELLTVALTQLHDFQVDPARTARRQQQRLDALRDVMTTALRTEAA